MYKTPKNQLIAKLLVYAISLIFVAWIYGVTQKDWLNHYYTKYARYFNPPFFTLVVSTREGVVSPFKTGMTSEELIDVALNSGLKPVECLNRVTLKDLNYKAKYCFLYGRTGTRWDIWMKHDRLSGIRAYASPNFDS